jgi:hypothetical protein
MASIASAAESSDYFMIGKSFDELVSAHSKKADFLASPQQVSFRDDINSITCIFVYLLKDGKSTSVLCFARDKNIKFAEATKRFSSLVKFFLDTKVINGTSLRINGVPILGWDSIEGEPLNYIRISGEWTSEYNFEARLDGSFTEKSMEASDVSQLSLTLGIKTTPPRGP